MIVKIKKKTIKLNNAKVFTKKREIFKGKENIISKKVRKVLLRKKTKEVKKEGEHIKLEKSLHNPIISPRAYSWESEASFNPAAVISGGRVHLFYRALGADGISRIGYASSLDGINFDERLYHPIYSVRSAEETKNHWPFTSPARPVYDNALYSSGGGWGGCEDPRTVIIDEVLYMTLNIFNGWNSLRVGVISIKEADLLNKRWDWSPLSYLSHLGDRQKNWVLFPEKINGKFAIFHNLDLGDRSRVGVTYVNNLDTSEAPVGSDPGSAAPDPQRLPDHIVAWHKRTRSASCPPIKTKDGWLLLYHAMDKDNENRYKLGAMLLDLSDPRKVLYRASHPILEPDLWYENDYKPGIIYASGAVVKKDKLFVYYGGGDKHIGVASIKLSTLIDSMKNDGKTQLEKNNKIELS
ncbi:MAG: hypothetical protein WCW04_03115 [Candidatus Paceibacterota bacterium]